MFLSSSSDSLVCAMRLQPHPWLGRCCHLRRQQRHWGAAGVTDESLASRWTRANCNPESRHCARAAPRSGGSARSAGRHQAWWPDSHTLAASWKRLHSEDSWGWECSDRLARVSRNVIIFSANKWIILRSDFVAPYDEGHLPAPGVDEGGPAGVDCQIFSIAGTHPQRRIFKGLSGKLKDWNKT